MKDNIIAILMYLFHNHFRNEGDGTFSEDALTEELTQAGFFEEDIYTAFDWLKHLLALAHAEQEQEAESVSATRVFSDAECFLFSPEVQSYLYSLEHKHILNAITRERVINRLLTADVDEISIEYVKMVTLMVLCSKPNEDMALARMEQMILAENGVGLH